MKVVHNTVELHSAIKKEKKNELFFRRKNATEDHYVKQDKPDLRGSKSRMGACVSAFTLCQFPLC